LQAQGGRLVVAEGRQVSFDYTLTVDGSIADSSQGRGPLKYTHGSGQIIPGLARELEGLSVGDEKLVVVSPKDGYGEVNPAAFQEMPRSKLPEGITPQAGMQIVVQNQAGQAFPAKITEVKDDSVIVDLNHPMAGKTLNFQVKIVAIE